LARAERWLSAAAAATLVAFALLGCEKLVGIEDVKYLSGDGAPRSDAATADDATPDLDAGPTCSALPPFVATCAEAGTFPRGFVCNPMACSCQPGLSCLYSEAPSNAAIGYCCDVSRACASLGDPCTTACDCHSGKCAGQQCR